MLQCTRTIRLGDKKIMVMAKRQSLLLVSTCSLVLATASLIGCSSQSKANGGPDQGAAQAMPVKVQTVSAQKVSDFTEYLATLKSRRSSVVQPQVDGQVTKIFVRSGDRVSAGTPILQIDPLKQQAAVNNLEANRESRLATLQLAEKELQRRRQLAAAGVVSKQDLDQAQTAFDAARADVEGLAAGVREQRVQLQYYTVKALSDGVVGDIPVRVGDRVSNQTVLTTLDQGGELEAYISVPADRAGDLRRGTPIEIVNGEGAVRTTVSFVSPRVDPETQLLLIKAAVPNKDGRFRNEQVVHARVLWREVERPLIPVTAVSRVSGQTFAFVAEQNGDKAVARQRAITVGEIMGNNYVVLEGVNPGDKLITGGVQMLADGMPVKPQA